MATARHLATAADLLAMAEAERYHEIIDGELVRKPAASGPHGHAHACVAAKIGDPYDRRLGGLAPGGWRILLAVEVELETHQVYRPDVPAGAANDCPSSPTKFRSP